MYLPYYSVTCKIMFFESAIGRSSKVLDRHFSGLQLVPPTSSCELTQPNSTPMRHYDTGSPSFEPAGRVERHGSTSKLPGYWLLPLSVALGELHRRDMGMTPLENCADPKFLYFTFLKWAYGVAIHCRRILRVPTSPVLFANLWTLSVRGIVTG